MPRLVGPTRPCWYCGWYAGLHKDDCKVLKLLIASPADRAYILSLLQSIIDEFSGLA